ncbi:ankyrin-2-like [Lineus longissimus]|uniref:ankyrin-2-like n=1 Tax=Lineus longissimus TaxID=88925 RepID=UPI00315C8A0F
MLRAGLYELNVMSCQVDLSMELPPKERFMNDALQYAVQTNNIERVEMLLNQGVDITWKCQVSELSPLQSALKLEHIKIFKLLLDHGANAVEFFFWMVDLDAKDIAILKVVQNHPEILTYLFEHDVLPGTNAYWQEWAAFVDVLTHLSSNSTVDLEKLYKVLLSCVMVCPSQNEKSVELQGHQFVKCTHLDLRLVLLFNAIESKSVSCVNLLLQHGVPVNILGPDMKNGCLYDETPLHRACRYDSIEIVKVLLKNGAKFVCCEEALTPLDVAYNELSVEIMWLFVANGYTSESIKSYKLNVACLLQEVDLVRELIDDGADVNKFDHKGRMPLIMAIYVKNMALFKLLLKAGALPYMPCFHKPNPCTGLHCPANSVRRAVEYKNAEALDCLLDILCEDIPLTKRFSDSSRLLVNAITSGDYKTFDVLMKRGADCVSRVYDGFAPIHIAAHEGDVSMLKALVERGVCVNDNAATKKHVHVRDERCEKKEKYCCIDFEEVDHRPLFLTKSAECIRFLLEKGADIHSVGCEGYLRDVLAEDGKFLDELTPRHRARILTTY